MNILVFPKLEKWFGCVRTFCVASFVLFVTTIAIPFLTEFLAHCLEQEESDNDRLLLFSFWAAAPEGQMTYDSTQDDFLRFPNSVRPPL